jgi:hypothetical protein
MGWKPDTGDDASMKNVPEVLRWEVLSVFEEQRRQEVSWAGSLTRVMMPL